MENYSGAIKAKINTDSAEDYQEAGKRLTRAAASRIAAGCVVCGCTDRPMFLIHVSVKSDDTISLLVCHDCGKVTSVFEMCELTANKIVESKSSSLQ